MYCSGSPEGLMYAQLYTGKVLSEHIYDLGLLNHQSRPTAAYCTVAHLLKLSCEGLAKMA